MTQTTIGTEGQPAPGPVRHKPATDAAGRREVTAALRQARERVERIRTHPQDHKPRLVTSEHVKGSSVLDKIADAVNVFCGSMWVFLFITVGIVTWLLLGPLLAFDKVPWPLLLTILNLPQLSIMISLQVSANRALVASDRRAIADHETLISLHEMAKQQLDILNAQNRVLDILDNFASNDMPGRQAQIQETVQQILAAVSGGKAPAG